MRKGNLVTLCGLLLLLCMRLLIMVSVSFKLTRAVVSFMLGVLSTAARTALTSPVSACPESRLRQVIACRCNIGLLVRMTGRTPLPLLAPTSRLMLWPSLRLIPVPPLNTAPFQGRAS